uniref:7TM GPCR serpentine receptor class x (Srx) domain-containing protein n=1 Tax=Panagrellus redivivus TaxID=6233 RepID=A0A7E4V7M6_PANRE
MKVNGGWVSLTFDVNHTHLFFGSRVLVSRSIAIAIAITARFLAAIVEVIQFRRPFGFFVSISINVER